MNDYIFDSHIGMYYSEVSNQYISKDEYKALGTVECKGCHTMIEQEQICWCSCSP